jgi:hypothetical protein
MQLLHLLLATLVVTATLGAATIKSAADVDPPVLIFSADDGTYSGMSELYYISDATRIVHNFTSLVPGCQSAYVGVLTLAPQYLPPTGGTINVVLVTTGIGETTSTLCTTQVLHYLSTSARSVDPPFQAVAPHIHNALLKSVTGPNNLHTVFPMAMYLGTSGWTPSVGSLEPLEAQGCSVNARAPITPISIGSVCVSPMAFSLRCGFWVDDIGQDSKGGECTSLPTPQHSNKNIFGRCHRESPAGGKDIVKLVLAAQGGNQWIDEIPATEGVRQAMQSFWTNHQVGPVAAPHTGSKPWDQTPYIFTQCAESTDHAIFVGAKDDTVCRRRVAELMGPFGVPGHQDAPVCVSAMEGFGYFQAMSQTAIPSINVRGASNYDMYPLYAQKNTEFWKQNVSYVSPDQHDQFSKDGYQYAIHTTNHVILKTLGHWKASISE